MINITDTETYLKDYVICSLNRFLQDLEDSIKESVEQNNSEDNKNLQKQIQYMSSKIREYESRLHDFKYPTFTDGDLVKVGDMVYSENKNKIVKDIQLSLDTYTIDYLDGSRDTNRYHVDIFKKKILDLDGAPINIGDTVYGYSDHKKWYVIDIDTDNDYPVVSIDSQGEKKNLKNNWLAHIIHRD